MYAERETQADGGARSERTHRGLKDVAPTLRSGAEAQTLHDVVENELVIKNWRDLFKNLSYSNKKS